jgi:hypothetical protein
MVERQGAAPTYNGGAWAGRPPHTPHKVFEAMYNGLKIRFDMDSNKLIAITNNNRIKEVQLWIGDGQCDVS